MDPVFCCSKMEPHKPTRTSDDPKFHAFRNSAMQNDVRFLCKSRKSSVASALTTDSASTTNTQSTSASSFSAGDAALVTKALMASPSPTVPKFLFGPEQGETENILADTLYLIQVIRRYDLGTIEWVRYFANSRGDTGGRRGGWMEVESVRVGEEWCVGENFKNFGCKYHYRLFEMNIFERT